MKNIIFILADYSQDDYEKIKSLDYKYLILCREATPTGQVITGYIEFKNGSSLKALEEVNRRLYYEKRKGSQKNTIDLYKKKYNYEEYGSKSTRPRMVDIGLFDFYK